MTPGVLLTGFCATMAAIAVGRLATGERRECVEVGSALVVIGFTLLSAAWAASEMALLGVGGQILLAICGTAVLAVGVAVIRHHWNDRREPPPAHD